MIYEYIIDADEPYESWYTSIFSTELLSREEFEEVVKKAQDSNLHDGKYRCDWNEVANAIVKMDNRFFFPEKGRAALIKWSNNNKFEGVY